VQKAVAAARHGSRWPGSSPGSARTRSPNWSRPLSGGHTRPARSAGGVSGRCRGANAV